MLNQKNSPDVFDMLDEPGDPPETETASSRTEAEGPQTPENAVETQIATPTTAPDLDTADATAAPLRGNGLLRRAIAAAVIVLVVTVAGLSLFLGWQLKQREDTADAGRAALEVARGYAVTLTSVDTKNIDQNFKQVLDGATGEFKDMYSQSASQLRQVLIDNKARSTGTVADAAIKSVTTNKVEVLLFVDQSISNTANPEPRIDRSRVAVTMELVDNRWLASKVDIK
ncbi:hypothetical protein [Mycobacteroides salmoniphilum]|uniref:hypothetical protein n=1 Tax=Mycobacteroides salmoniphilum TaxID=404941 RepID=UPI0010F43130|nr:hypothetical protein [Mycobacteroides salmoniphilum]TDZ99340.1 hypothetical protein CCUG62472_00578 [Mycobacteroides salmoniphilum]